MSKVVFLKNIENNQEIETTIYLNETIGDLKRKIEKLFNLKNGLLDSEYKLKMKFRGSREGILLGADNTTLEFNHVKSYSVITFMKTKNKGANLKLLPLNN